MRSVFFFSLAVSVASVFSQQPFVRYQEKLRRAVPHHYNHDEKNIDRGLDQVARRHQVEPHQPPLQPRQEVPWQRWVHEGRWAAQADKNTELHKVRAHLLAEKLKPNQFVFKPRVNPQLKPKLDRKVNARVKREVENGVKRETKNTNAETIKEERKEEHVRHKRDLSMIQPEPEINVQPELEAKSPNDQYDGRTRSKRQIVLFLPQPPPQQLMARSPRTTPNPFVRDTHVDDYDIIRPNRGEREGMIPSVEGGSGSDTLVTLPKALSDFPYELLKTLRNQLMSLMWNDREKLVQSASSGREKRSPKMSKLKQKQKIEKKKRKKKKQKELSPRQLKNFRRKKEKKERRKRLHDKKLKEKRRLRHKKLGTGPYNKTITDYYGIYYEPASSQLNESLYDSIYDTSEIDSDAIYEERMKERYDDYPESESVDSDAWYDEQIYGETKESGDEGEGNGETTNHPGTAGSKTTHKPSKGTAGSKKKE